MALNTEMRIDLPARDGVPAVSLYAKVLTQENMPLGNRDVLILVPGGPGNDHTMYDTPVNSIAKALFPAVDIILFDPRGCGRSEKSAVEYCSLDHYVEDIEAIRVYFKLPADKFLVFGQSYGSLAATAYAMKYPDHLKKLFLIGGVASSDFMQEAKSELQRIGTAEQIKFAEKIWHGSFNGSMEEVADFYRVMGPLYSYSFVATASDDSEATLDIPYNVDIMNYGWGTFLQKFDFRPELGKIKCPTLILWGENEWIMSRNQIQQLQQGIKNSQLITYKECSHMLWIDQWERFVKDALVFLKE